MRHRKTQRKLGRKAPHRIAMYRNMVSSLIEHERITTTLAKAKELRSQVEKTITLGKRLDDVLQKERDTRTRSEQMRYANTFGRLAKRVNSIEVIHKLFDNLVPRLRERPGGYTRIVQAGFRVGDAAPMAVIELVCRDSAMKKADAAAPSPVQGSDSASTVSA